MSVSTHAKFEVAKFANTSPKFMVFIYDAHSEQVLFGRETQHARDQTKQYKLACEIQKTRPGEDHMRICKGELVNGLVVFDGPKPKCNCANH